MDIIDTYKTIKEPSQGLYKDKGSRFISFAFPVSGESEIKLFVDQIRQEHHDARHHCYAWILGIEGLEWRANDDGEPSGTAGRPILGQIRSASLTNVLLVVTRYFGGKLLGVSGLTNAYKAAARSAISNAEIIDRIVSESYELMYPYDMMNDVMKILKEAKLEQYEHSFGLECRINVNIRLSEKERLLSRFKRIEGLTYRFLTSGKES
ncbi:MAG: YigZ family protein [Bacteroidales bacterium]|nr:YigZ family protein [Bacteroidales bacterium]MBN2861838.1 YigZ family protein [Bacteroidales bacterium]